ncbi:MAG: FAD-binding and (Fe-S)-binding domain-containing protein [Lautropia sp.]
MNPADPSSDRTRLAQRLRRVLRGDVLFDAASRGRYATDASIYQVDPIGVVVPADEVDVVAALALAREMKVPLLPRGAGSSQCGQTVGDALVIDASRHLRAITAFDADAMTVEVQPGVVLDALNAYLKPHGLWFPVDVSTSAQATIGGMAGNNSCGSRSIAYGNMVHNVLAIDAILADGTEQRFGPFGAAPGSAATGDAAAGSTPNGRAAAAAFAPVALSSGRASRLVSRLFEIGARERDEIRRVWPTVMRRVGGYNLDVFEPRSQRPYTADGSVNLAHLLVGSEGTLAWFRRLTLQLARLPAHRVLGIVNFASFHRAMASAQHLVRLGPSAVELVDRTMIALARQNPAFRPFIDAALTDPAGPAPEAILLVEFSGDERAPLLARLRDLDQCVADLGLPGCVVAMPDPAAQQALWAVRKAGLNIMMSLKGDGKPVSFIEDCAVPLEHLADYTAALTEVFARHGTRGTWYAHASVGTLHVRPILDLRVAGPAGGAARMRAIAEEASELVRRYKGAFSGEHGDGLVRSEWVAWQFGPRLARAFEEVKDLFDPERRMNPGKIVRASRMDDARLFRYQPGYAVIPIATALDWSAWDVTHDPVTERTGAPGSGNDPAGGLSKAVEMCNNNGHCRKFDADTMCPSYRVTRRERDLTRGRANTLRLALSGQLGPDGIRSDAVADALSLCVGCKGCRRECPTGVDMARMKIEMLAQRHPGGAGLGWRDRLVAGLPRWAGRARRFGPLLAPLLAWRERSPWLARLVERRLGIAAARSLPRFAPAGFDRGAVADAGPADATTTGPAATDPAASGLAATDSAAADSAAAGFAGTDVVLWVDTFNDAFEPRILDAALRVLRAGGRRVAIARPAAGDAEPDRPLCCGRTRLALGQVDAARAEAERTIAALAPYAARGCAIVGLEPSCLLTFRDEYLALRLAGAEAIAGRAMLFETFIDREWSAGRFALPLGSLGRRIAHLHGHCHQKAFDAMGPVERVLRHIPELEVRPIVSSCCGMAGSFGYQAETHATSVAMAELSLLPAVRAAAADDLIVADGTSCRHQIRDGTGRQALHVAEVLAMALDEAP